MPERISRRLEMSAPMTSLSFLKKSSLRSYRKAAGQRTCQPCIASLFSVARHGETHLEVSQHNLRPFADHLSSLPCDRIFFGGDRLKLARVHHHTFLEVDVVGRQDSQRRAFFQYSPPQPFWSRLAVTIKKHNEEGERQTERSNEKGKKEKDKIIRYKLKEKADTASKQASKQAPSHSPTSISNVVSFTFLRACFYLF